MAEESSSQRPAWQTDELGEEWIEQDSESMSLVDDNLSYGTRSISFTTPLASHLHNEDDNTNTTIDHELTSHPIGTFHVRDDVQQAPLFPKTPGRGNIQTFFTPSKLERMFEPPTPPLPPLPAISDVSPLQPTTPHAHIAVTSPSCRIEPPEGPFTFAMTPSPQNYPASQSTPNARRSRGNPAPDTPLRLFQFNYDTYTRDHLSALVDSIAANTPGTGTTSSKPTSSRPLSRLSETSVTDLRSTKRIKLSPMDGIDADGDGFGATISRPVNGKDYVSASQSLMDQIRKKAMDTSTMSIVLSSRVPGAGHDSVADVQEKESPAPRASLLNVPQQSSPVEEESVASGSTRPSSTAFTYRQRGADLLAQIRNDMKGPKRVFSGESDIASVATVMTEDKENQKETSFHHRSSSTRSNSSFKSSSSRRHTRQRPTMPAFSQPPVTQVFAIPAAPNFDHLVPQPSFLQPPQQASLMPPSRPTGQPQDDLNRYVSSSTASGTTLTTGTAASYMKHAGPAHLRTIAPTDIPELPQKLGGMIFDKLLMRWVKGIAGDVPPEESFGEEETEDPFGDIESIKDDTGQQRSIISAPPHPDESVASFRKSLSDTETVTDHQVSVEHAYETDDDDDDEMELTSFSTDGQSLRVVQVMTGDETTDSEADISTEGVVAVFPTQNDGFDSTFTSDEEGFEPNFHFQEDLEESLSAITLSPPPTPPPPSIPPVPPVTTPVRNPQNVVEPGGSIIRSALKNATTPISSNTANKRKTEYQTPYNQSRHRRSVSFSDGKREGPIRGLHRKDEDASFVLSTRTKRIVDLVQNMADDDSGFSDDSPTKGPPPENKTGAGHGQTVSTGHSRFDRDFTPSPENPHLQSRRLSRAHSFRSSPGEAGQATFLTECSFGVAHDRLVQVITDVQPFEPHWEELSAIDLSDKKIESVARLKEFLPHLEGLVLNSNHLSWLSGVPKTVRTLSVASNELTEVTSFSHLLKLESLDISNNQLESLSQLSCLRKLRELRADANKITSLDGLEKMSRLVKLSVEGNRITGDVDLSRCEWDDLEGLNLSRNRITDVKGLEGLNNLVILNLESNSLTTLTITDVLSKLRILRMSGNKMGDLGAIFSGRFPNLRTLYADDNRLPLMVSERGGGGGGGGGGVGVVRSGKIESLSLRNQKVDRKGKKGKGDDALVSILHDVRDVKRLYLSGNAIPTNSPLLTKSAYNLVYLELAGCSLKTIPFPTVPLGAIAPNIRVLNLNYNFLDDAGFLSLVAGSTTTTTTTTQKSSSSSSRVRLERLRKLSVVGSRIGSVKTIVSVLEGLAGDEVELLDFRMNPCTLGWYLPVFVPGSGGSTTTNGGSGGGPMKNESGAEYRKLDTNFRRSLPDSGYVGRLAYRGLIMRVCGQMLKEIDGIGVGEKERMKAEQVLARIER